MNETITVGELTGNHIGRTVVVTETGGSVITGVITSLHPRISWAQLGGKGIYVDLDLETANGKYKLDHAELTYLVQLEPVTDEAGEQ